MPGSANHRRTRSHRRLAAAVAAAALGPVLLAAAPAAAARVLRLAAATADPGSEVDVALVLEAPVGDENALGLSVAFDPGIVALVGAALAEGGAGATLLLNANRAADGAVGLGLAMPAGEALPAAAGPLVHLRFRLASGCSGIVARLALTDSPVRRELVDTLAGAVAATWLDGSVTSGTATATPTLTAVRQGDDVRLDFAGGGPGPWRVYRDGDRATLGVTPLATAATGWTDLGAVSGAPSPLYYQVLPGCAPTLRVDDTTTTSGSRLALPIRIESQGNVAAVGLNLWYDPALLLNPSVETGLAQASLFSNGVEGAQGHLGLLVGLFGATIPAGTVELALVTFDVAAVAAATDTPLAFGPTPITPEVSDALGNPLAASFVPGTLSIVP